MKNIFVFIIISFVLGVLWWSTKKSEAIAGRRLTIYLYANYLEPSVLQEFKKEYDVDIIEENCSSNEEVEGKLKLGASGYDLIVPSDYMVPRLIAQRLIKPLDRSKLANLRYLSTNFKSPAYDPEGKYVVPYMWGTTGIGYDSKLVTNPPSSWQEFFDPTRLQDLKRRISILDDPREVIGAALRASGYSVNDASPAALAAAKEKIKSILPMISRIDSNSFKDLLASGDIWLAQGYSGDILRLRKELPNIRYLIPKDGGTIWADNLAIPANAQNQDLAYLFIDFIMRPEINARLASYIQYATTNEGAKAFIPKELLEDPNIYPDPEIEQQLDWFKDLGDKADEMDKVWNEVRASSAFSD